MAQASSRWQQLTTHLQDLPLSELNSGVLKQLPRRLRGKGWLLGSSATVAVLVLNWKLFLATGVGLSTIVLVNWMQSWDWQTRLTYLQQLLKSSNRPLVLAAGSGGIAMFSTYLAASIWADSESAWIATGAIFQGLGTLTVVILLCWQILQQHGQREVSDLNSQLDALTHSDPLKRLVAVRQLTHLLSAATIDPLQHQVIADAFRLLLNQEPEAIVRNAVLAGLQQVEPSNPTHQLSAGAQPFAPPVMRRSPAKVRRSTRNLVHESAP